LSELEQSFVILDSLPNGQKKYIDLLNPHNEPMHYNTLVTKYKFFNIAKISFNSYCLILILNVINKLNKRLNIFGVDF